jgi:hypothetical protein
MTGLLEPETVEFDLKKTRPDCRSNRTGEDVNRGKN